MSGGGFAIGDVTMSAIYKAMQGLQDRQQAIANNISNISTPGYTAQNVNFESSLAKAVAGGDPSQAQISVTASGAAAQQNGNNVNLDDQTVMATQSQESYQTMIDAMNNKFKLINEAIGQGGAA